MVSRLSIERFSFYINHNHSAILPELNDWLSNMLKPISFSASLIIAPNQSICMGKFIYSQNKIKSMVNMVA